MYSNSTLIQVYGNNVVFALKIRLSLYKIVTTYLLSPLFNAIFHFYKIILCVCFPYVIMYTLYISKALKICQSMKSKILSLKSIIKKLNFLKKTFVI